MKAAHLRQGDNVESISLKYLQSNGLILIERNFRSYYGEIDLVMMDRLDLVFIEVRYRKNDLFGGPSQSVHTKKQLKIRRTAQAFLQKEVSLEFDGCRFDVMAVSGQPSDYQVDWIRNAFE